VSNGNGRWAWLNPLSFNSSMAKPVVVIQFKDGYTRCCHSIQAWLNPFLSFNSRWKMLASDQNKKWRIFWPLHISSCFDKMLFQCNICGKMWNMFIRRRMANFLKLKLWSYVTKFARGFICAIILVLNLY
jgi:hypothetical protein